MSRPQISDVLHRIYGMGSILKKVNSAEEIWPKKIHQHLFHALSLLHTANCQLAIVVSLNVMRMRLSLGDAPICSTTTFCIQVSLGLQANLDGSKARFFVKCPVSPQKFLPILAFKLMNNLDVSKNRGTPK